MPKFSVAIVGAGLSGLAFAVALQKYAPDVEFQIYEGASQLAEIGAGIAMQRRTWSIMQALGVEADLLKIVGDGERPALSVTYRKSDQVEGELFHTVTSTQKSYTVHRAELHNVFREHLQSPHTIHLGKRLASYTYSAEQVDPVESDTPSTGNKIHIRFQDGTTASCDVLVGCDGVRSSTRAAMYTRLADAAQAEGRQAEAEELKKHIPAVSSGSLVYRMLIRKDALSPSVAALPALNKPNMTFYCGRNRYLIGYPISKGRTLNVAACVYVEGQEGKVYQGLPSSTVSKEEISKHFSGWEPDVEEILKHIDGALEWPIIVTTKLPTYVDGRVALLGDAAHGMTPHQGAGAGQCFEDVLLLARFLGHTDVSLATVSTALQVYDEIRRPYSQAVVELSRRSGQLHSLNTPECDLQAESQSSPEHWQLFEEIGRELEGLRTHWRLTSSLAEQTEVSMKMLVEALSRTV